MISRYEVTLNPNNDGNAANDKKLSDINSNLLILDVAYGGIQYQDRDHTSAGLDGYEAGERYADRQTVTVTFQLRIYGTSARNTACRKVAEWAESGGTLKVNDRPGQYLKVRCKQPPAVGSVRNWLDPLTVVFESVEIPYWRNVTKTVKTATGSGTFKLTINPGGSTKHVKTPLSAKITAKAKVTTIKITCAGTMLYLKGFSLAKNKQMVISYVNDRYLSITVDGDSFLKYLQPTSSDRLLAFCDVAQTIVVTTDNSATATFEAEGLWL